MYSSVSRYTKLISWTKKKGALYHYNFKTSANPSEDHLVITSLGISFAVYHAVQVWSLTKHLMRNKKSIFTFTCVGRIFLLHQYSKTQPHRKHIYKEKKQFYLPNLTKKLWNRRNANQLVRLFIRTNTIFSIWDEDTFTCHSKMEYLVPFVTSSQSNACLVSAVSKAQTEIPNFHFWGGDSLLSPSDAKGELRSEA